MAANSITSFSAPSGFSKTFSAFIGVFGPFLAFLRVSGAFMGDAAHRKKQKKKPLSAPPAKEPAIREGGNPGPSRSSSAVSALLSAIRSGKPFLCRSAVIVLPSFLSVVIGPFCPFAWKRIFLCHPESLALESRPRSARSDLEFSQAMKSNLTRWEYIYYYLSYI